MLVAASVEHGLRVHVAAGIPGTAGLDRSSDQARKTRFDGSEGSADSGSLEPVSGTVAGGSGIAVAIPSVDRRVYGTPGETPFPACTGAYA